MLALGLLFLKPSQLSFFLLYFTCGFTDVLDGYLARKLEATSQFGSFIDSLADTIFIGVIFIIFFPLYDIPIYLLVWVTAIAGVRLLSLGIGFLKYRVFGFLHTYANKVAGIAMFFFPIFVYGLGVEITGILLCMITSCSSFEELFITLKSKEFDSDIESLLHRR